jgi:acyl-CoA thioesterase FadM
MTDAVIVFTSEGFYGDIITIDVTVADFSRTGCNVLYRLLSRETGKEVARAKTGIVFFDYNTRKVVSVPEKFKKVLGIKQ